MGKFAIYYGTANHKIDVTGLALQRCMANNVIIIPSNDDNRAAIFSDPTPGILKSIFIEMHDKITEYNDASQLHITIQMQMDQSFNNVQQKLKFHHSKLQIMHGSFHDEYPEQLLAVEFLKGEEKVLEIGGNIGRNSLIIASILSNQKNLVVLESDEEIGKKLTQNRDINNMEFHIENSALSKRKLIQHEWETKCSDVLEPGWKNVNILSLEQLQEKYKIDFDTLILDCEGAFYYILQDMPEILKNVKLIIMENDYFHYGHYKYVENKLLEHGFQITKRLSGGWGPCYNNFYEVWNRSDCIKLNKLQLAFYTCFYGTDNNVACAIPELPSEQYSCYFYTNNRGLIDQLKHTKWIPVYDEKPIYGNATGDTMSSKHIKTCPQDYAELQNYDYLCFFDSKIRKINESFVEDCIKKHFIEGNYALLLREHWFVKENVWNEFNESMLQERYRLERGKLETYIKTQLAAGFNEKTKNHCACGFLIRNMKHEKIKEIGKTWYAHIQECGIQDQISFFFVKQMFEECIYPFKENPFDV